MSAVFDHGIHLLFEHGQGQNKTSEGREFLQHLQLTHLACCQSKVWPRCEDSNIIDAVPMSSHCLQHNGYQKMLIAIGPHNAGLLIASLFNMLPSHSYNAHFHFSPPPIFLLCNLLSSAPLSSQPTATMELLYFHLLTTCTHKILHHPG